MQESSDASETESCSSRVRQYIGRRVFDIVLTIVLLVLGGAAHFYPQRPRRFFVERDPTLSYPYIGSGNDEISMNALIFLAIMPTIVIVFACQVMVWLCQRRRPGAIPHAAVYFWGRPLLSLGQAEGFALLVTETLKNWQGRYRPNLFAACNYAGYRDALATGDFSFYDNHTRQGHPGDLGKCFDRPDWLDDTFTSNPSGHASVIFAAWTGMGLILTYLFRSQRQYLPEACGKAWVSLFMVIPITAAALVMATRTRDYVHDFSDTTLGAGIGIGSAVMFFMFNYGTDPSHDGLFRRYRPRVSLGQELPKDVDDHETAARAADGGGETRAPCECGQQAARTPYRQPSDDGSTQNEDSYNLFRRTESPGQETVV